MKKLVHALICLSISLVVLNCTNEEQMPVQGKVQIAINLASKSADGGRTQFTSFPEGAYISLSIETAAGTAVYSLEHVDLIQLGDGYVTAPLDLTEGNYRLTDFFVMSEGSDVLFAIPKEGSDLAGLVDDPLPILFSITADGIVNLDVQVVDVDQQSPEDFGYVSFGVEVVGSDYSVSLFTDDGDELNLASGKLELYQGNDLVYGQDLDAKVNAVNFKGDPDATYELVIQKEGYSIFHREYELHDLLDELDGKPLAVYIVPALTFTIIDKYSSPSLTSFIIDISGPGPNGESPDLIIDWGDGTIQHGIDFDEPGAASSHSYENPGKRFYINMYGAVDDIKRIGCNYQLPVDVQKVDLTSLTGLVEFVMVLTQSAAPKFIDFSMNSNLEMVVLESSYVEGITISSANRSLNIVDVDDTAISEENFNDMISQLHTNAIEQAIYGGYVAFVKNPYYGTPEPLFPLSEETKSKLVDLRDNYDWNFYPNPQ